METQGRACAYCNREEFFAERLIEENEFCFVLATLGQITDGGHVLVVPRRHASCCAGLSKAEMAELHRTKNRVAQCIAKAYGIWPLVFEHGIIGQTVAHAHLHFLPANIQFSHRIRKDFPGSAVENVLYYPHIRRMYLERGEPYLYWHENDPDTGDAQYLCWNPQDASRQYLRILAAEAVGIPGRANWKNVDRDEDRRLWHETVSRLRAYC